MTPARQELVRLALEMPDEGIATCARSMIWICPGLARPELTDANIAQRVQRTGVLISLAMFYDVIVRLPEDDAGRMLRTLRKLAECYGRIAADRAPKPPRFAGNVVELFAVKRG